MRKQKRLSTKRKNGQREPVPLWMRVWPLAAFAGILVLLAVSIVSGWTLFSVGKTTILTVYGSVLVFRKVVQTVYAFRNNVQMMRIVRQPIINRLLYEFPGYEEEIRQLGRSGGLFDRFRQEVKDFFGWDDEDWWQFRQRMLQDRGSRLSEATQAPVFRIPLEQVETMMRSAVAQTYPVDHVFMIVNEHDPRTYNRLQAIKAELSRPFDNPHRTEFHILEELTKGKRAAMNTGFYLIFEVATEIALNVDGDTHMDVDAVYNMVETFDAMPEVACLTGDVRVWNWDVNLLTLLTAIRYFVAFLIERAAQSYWGQMTCMSGPFLAMRTEKLKMVVDEWYNQTFLGAECTYGDDRHLTTLALIHQMNGESDWKCVFTPECIVWTDCPTEVPVWKRQQLRWNKSAYRENWWLWEYGKLTRLHPFIVFDLFYLTFFPYLIAGAVFAVLGRAVGVTLAGGIGAGIALLLPYVLSVLLLNFIFQSLYGLVLHRDWRYFLSPLYVYLYFRHLLFLKIWALIKLRDTQWGTRKEGEGA